MVMARVMFVLSLLLLAAISLAGCGSETTEPAPGAHFSAFPTGGYVPSEVQFTDKSIGKISKWEWDLDGDGIVDSTRQSPRHTYDTPGTYTITMTVTGPGGISTQTREEYLAFRSTPCTADFVVSTSRSDDGLEASFTAQSTGYVSGWAWDFDDDGVIDSTEEDPTYTYTEFGLYSVSLTITTPGCEDTVIKVDHINYDAPPEARFSAAATAGQVPVTIQFLDLSSGEIRTWKWDFDNDGKIDSTDRNPAYTYEEAGTYTVKLTVTGPNGTDAVTRRDYVQVAPPSTPSS
jgi:PKD repeat protein